MSESPPSPPPPSLESALRRVAQRLLRDAADQDDAIQEMWLAHVQASGEERGAAGWKVQVLRHRAMRIWTRRMRDEEVSLRAERPRGAPDPAEVMDGQLVRELLLGSIAQLPEAQARTVRARFFEELTVGEIARREGSTESTVRTRLSRGLAALRERMDSRTGDPRLTALALIGAFRWDRAAVLAQGAAGGAGGSLVWAGLGLLAVVAAGVGAWLLRAGGDGPPRRVEDVLLGGGERVEGDPELAAVSAPVSSREAAAEVPAGPGGPAAAAAPAAAGADPVPALGEGRMAVTLRCLDAAGLPVPGFYAKANLPSDRGAPLRGPAGVSGELRFVVSEEYFWRYDSSWKASTSGRGIYAEREGAQVRFSVEHAGAVQGTRLHVPFVAGSERTVEVTLDMNPHELRGRVVDPEGRGIADAGLFPALSSSRDVGDLWYTIQNPRARTDVDGSFVLDRLPAGALDVQIFADGYVASTPSLTPEPIATPVELVLQRAVRVSGVVRDGDGRPVPGAVIHSDVDKEEVRTWSLADQDGAFVYERLPPGIHRLWAEGPRGSELEGHVVTETLSTESGEIVWNPMLTPPRELHVQVLDAEGDPVEGQMVLLMSGVGPYHTQWWELVGTDAEGRVSVRQVPEGNVRLELRAGVGGWEQSLSPVPFRVIEPVVARDEPYVVRLEPDERRFGSIVCRAASAGARGSAPDEWSLIGGLSNNANIGPPVQEGTLRCEGLPPGPTTVVFEGREHGVLVRQVTVEADREIDLGDVTMPPTGTLRMTNGWPAKSPQGYPVETYFAAEYETVHGPHQQVFHQVAEPFRGDLELLPGRVLVLCVVAGRLYQQEAVTIRSGEVTELDLDPRKRDK